MPISAHTPLRQEPPFFNCLYISALPLPLCGGAPLHREVLCVDTHTCCMCMDTHTQLQKTAFAVANSVAAARLFVAVHWWLRAASPQPPSPPLPPLPLHIHLSIPSPHSQSLLRHLSPLSPNKGPGPAAFNGLVIPAIAPAHCRWPGLGGVCRRWVGVRPARTRSQAQPAQVSRWPAARARRERHAHTCQHTPA